MTQVYIIIALVIIFSFFLVQSDSLTKLDETQTPFKLSQSLVKVAVPSPGQNLQIGYLNITPPNSAVCTPGKKIAADLLIDTSGSMNNQPGKLDSLKNAVVFFANKLQDTDVLGAQRFSSGASDITSIDFVSLNRASFISTIQNLEANGGTETEKGLKFALNRMNTGFPFFPDHKKVFILLTDGCPNPDENPLPVAEEIKSSGSGIEVFTIGLELGTADKCESWGGVEGARLLMKQMATSNNHYFEPQADQLEEIYNKISSTICR